MTREQIITTQPACMSRSERAAILAQAQARLMQEMQDQIRIQNKAKAERMRSLLGAYKNKTFDNFTRDSQPAAYDKTAKYAEDLTSGALGERNGLILSGSPGTGKTHLASATANAALDTGIPTLFGTLEDHLNRIKAEFGTEESGNYLQKLKTIQVLIIDDLYSNTSSEWAMGQIFEVINARYSTNLPTIITTNLGPGQLKSFVGERIFSRLAGMCRLITTTGEDWRYR